MMNLQRLAEVRSNLQVLASLAPTYELSTAVDIRLLELSTVSMALFQEPPKPPPPPEPIRHNHPTRVILDQGKCPACDEYHKKHPVRIRPPLPVPPMPEPPIASRKVGKSNSYNAERYVCYRVLWAKVIIRAAYDYALWKDSKDLRLRKFAQDAERWLFEPSDLELSFENICFAYDFPIERIRARSRVLTKNDVKKLEFRERHGARTDAIGEVTGGDDK